jgi:FlaA1/EpsC-like NDP-sugar epimerase
VTDPEITRYFMLIPEAVQLVLHAAAVGAGGETLVLDMGEQIRVLDLARNVITLSGHVPYAEIPIVFTGLRPGEKLFEELTGSDERMEPGAVDKILRIVSSPPAGLAIAHHLSELETRAAAGDADAVLDLLGRIVPSFRSVTHRQTA